MPNFTVHDQSGVKVYQDEIGQFEADWTAAEKAVFGYTNKIEDTYLIDRSIYPNLRRMQSNQVTSSNRYTLKTAPLNFLSCEFNVASENSNGDNLTNYATSEYIHSNAEAIEYSAAVKTSLNQALAIDSQYSHKTTLAGTGESGNNSHTILETASLKGLWNVNPNLTLTGTGAFSLNRNILEKSKIYSLSPAIGFIWRQTDFLRIDGDYSYTRYFSASSASKHTFSLKAKYSVSNFVDVSLRYERETSSSPYYRTTDLAGIVEINI